MRKYIDDPIGNKLINVYLNQKSVTQEDLVNLAKKLDILLLPPSLLRKIYLKYAMLNCSSKIIGKNIKYAANHLSKGIFLNLSIITLTSVSSSAVPSSETTAVENILNNNHNSYTTTFNLLKKKYIEGRLNCSNFTKRLEEHYNIVTERISEIEIVNRKYTKY